MSITRACFVVVQAICNQLSTTPPNPTPTKYQYFTEQPFILRIAPAVFKFQFILIWVCGLLEVFAYLQTQIPSSSPLQYYAHFLCLRPQADIHTTIPFIVGVVSVVLGTLIRLDCYRTLGEFFTFDLTILPEHKLITKRLYSIVRHPAYTGSLFLTLGVNLSHMTKGSWMTECGPLSLCPEIGLILIFMWCFWAVSVVISRARAEDSQMRLRFGEQWEAYATRVPWWVFPGLL